MPSDTVADEALEGAGGAPDGGEALGTTAEALQACSGAVDSIRYSYPFHHSWESWDLSYQDAPNGLAEYPNGGVMYDYHRCADEAHGGPGCSTPGYRDFMGGDAAYERHNGYDNSIGPARLVNEGMGEVYPLAAGTVVNVVNSSSPSEDVIIVQHSNGYFSRYVHLAARSPRVRVGDPVTPNTVLGTLGVAESHLHLDFHDCDYNPATDDPINPKESSYYEIYRADKHLFGRAPWYDSGPSDVVDLQVRQTADATGAAGDDMRFVVGDTVRLNAWGQNRTGDTVTVQVIDSNGVVKSSAPLQRTDLARWGRFSAPGSYTIAAGDPLNAWWTARVLVNGVLRHQKSFFVKPAFVSDNSSGPVQSTPSMVSWGTDNMTVVYRGADGNLKTQGWRANTGWSAEVNQGGPFLGDPSCVSRGANLVDCFLQGTDKHLYRWASTNGGASGGFSIIFSGGTLADPAAISWSANSMEVIFRRDDNKLGRMSWNGTTFTHVDAGPYDANDGPPACVAADATHWRCFAQSFLMGGLFELGFLNGVPSAKTIVSSPNVVSPPGDNIHVSAALWPGEGNQANRIDLTIRDNSGTMRRQSRIEYTSGAPAWMPSVLVGASFLTSVPPSCGMRQGTNLFECFSADFDHNLIKNSWTGTRWTSWTPVVGNRSPMDRFAPTVTALDNGSLDLFYSARPFTAQGTATNALIQRTAIQGVWKAEASIGGDNLYAPGCTASGGTTLDCFAVDRNGNVARRTSTRTVSGSWMTSTANVAGSAVTAISRTAGSVDIFYRSPTGVLITQALGASGWSNFPVSVGSPPNGGMVDAPGCVARRGTQVVDCFVRDGQNHLVSTTRDATGVWGSWSNVPGVAAFSAPSAVSTDANHVDVYYRGGDNTLRHIEWNAGTWGTEENLAGSIASAPSCALRQSPTRIDCFAQGFSNVSQDVLHYAFQASIGWFPPRALAMGLANLALNQPATQSSDAFGGTASRAVDGNLDGKYPNGSVTHTDNTVTADGFSWWQVDLGAVRPVDHIQVFNRTDCCSSRLNGFNVEVRNSAGAGTPWRPISTTFAQDIGTAQNPNVVNIDRTNPAFPGVAIPVKTSARYVRIRLRAQDFLSLAEVMVMGPER